MVVAEGSLPPRSCVTQNKWFAYSVPLCLCRNFTECIGFVVFTAGDGCYGGGDGQSKSSLGTKLGGGQDRAGAWGLWAILRWQSGGGYSAWGNVSSL